LAFTVQANITPKAAVKLVLTNDIQLNCYWHNTQAMAILTELLDMSIDEFLAIIDCISPWEQIDSATLPQFGSLETVLRVPEILFLNYLLRDSANPADVAKTEYDIEHCVPKKVLQEFFVKKGVAVPISAACNLVYIPKAENRSKGDLTYYQKQEKDAGTYSLNEDALDVLGYPRKKELDFVRSVETLTAANYYVFLNDREKFITQRMIKIMYS